jgi:GT2 family glycosyltransferase/glycosyltransferase involved in cell wall biosynthesis
MNKRRAGVVSVILVNFRGTDDTLTCIEELSKLDWPQDRLEIIVVENGSGDDSLKRLRAGAKNATILESKTNRGFTGGCNFGVEHSTGEVVAFLNNDARPDAKWISAAMATLDARPDVGSVASKVLDWEGANIDYSDAAMTWYGMGYKPSAGRPDDGSWEQERDVLFGTGAAMFVRAEVFEQLGGFDDRYFMFYEDVDLGWRMNLAGWKVRYQPASIAFHKHHASMKAFGDFRESYLLERNALFTLYKNLDDESLATVLPAALALAVRRGVARGGVDSTQLDLRVRGNDADPDMPVPKTAMAPIFGVDQFVELLPSVTETRRQIQADRVVSDRQLKRLFGKMDEPAYPIEDYLAGYDKIVHSLGVLDVAARRRILVITGDTVGKRMAGPAIRAWNIAQVLSEEHDVRLVSLSKASDMGQRFEVATASYRNHPSMTPHEEWADVIIVQGHALNLFPVLEKSRKIKVVDVYDPLHLEQLEQGREKPFDQWENQVSDATDALNAQLALGDFFLCASERQRFFWLGQLAGLGRVNARNYARDEDLNSLIAVAPFGMTKQDPQHTKRVIKGVVPGIGEDDKVVIWGGGIYNWFDPMTLVRAIALLAERRPNVKLFFLGVQHPNPDVPEMDIVGQTQRLSESLGLTGTHVFFNQNWVEYEDRQNYLLEADAGVSTHYQHIETTFSFRTRILDYLWAGLPMVSTKGDSFADLIAAEGLGGVVPERDVEALADALESVLYDEDAVATARENVRRVRERFTWERALAPLVEFCREPERAADRRPGSPEEPLPRGVRVGEVVIPKREKNYGVVHDLRRVVHYAREGGPRAVLGKLRERAVRRARLRD